MTERSCATDICSWLQTFHPG